MEEIKKEIYIYIIKINRGEDQKGKTNIQKILESQKIFTSDMTKLEFSTIQTRFSFNELHFNKIKTKCAN